MIVNTLYRQHMIRIVTDPVTKTENGYKDRGVGVGSPKFL